MEIDELEKKIKSTFGVEKVSADDLRNLKNLIIKHKCKGLNETDAITEAIQEVFSKRQVRLDECKFLVKGWDLSWFGSNSSAIESAIDYYLANKKD